MTDAAPFTAKPFLEPTFIQRVLRRPVPENGYIEVENLLAGGGWDRLHQGHVAEAMRRHGVATVDHRRFVAMYERAVVAFAQDLNLDETDLRRLKHLEVVLGIPLADVAHIRKKIVEPLYAKFADRAVTDGKLTPEEEAALDRLHAALSLDEATALRLYGEAASKRLQEAWDHALSDSRLSGTEEGSLAQMAGRLKVVPTLEPESESAVERARRMWRIESGSLPEVPVSINLRRGEVCHFSAAASWNQLVTVSRKINYAGPTARIRIMKGVYYRLGSVDVQSTPNETMQQVTTGTLYITSKRIVFDGVTKNLAITLQSVLSFTPYSNGIEVERAAGRNPIFLFDNPTEASAILSALLANVG